MLSPNVALGITLALVELRVPKSREAHMADSAKLAKASSAANKLAEFGKWKEVFDKLVQELMAEVTEVRSQLMLVASKKRELSKKFNYVDGGS